MYKTNLTRERMRSGKHTYLPAIQDNYKPGWSHSSANRHGGFVLVLVRHPLSWIASMCDKPYVCNWLGQNQKIGPSCVKRCTRNALNRTVYCSDNRGHHHADLAHLWANWYRAYANPHWLPRIFIRYEDLLLHPRLVWSYLCPCIGASAAESLVSEMTGPNGGKITLHRRRSPGDSSASGAKTALEHSIEKAKAVDEILRPFPAAQLTSLRRHAWDLLHLFGYRVPVGDRVDGDASK